MKIGDNVKVTFKDGTQAIGLIIGETATAWKIDFVDGDKPVAVPKSLNIELIIVKPNPTKPIVKPKKKVNWKIIVAIAVTIGGALVLILV